jgi:glycosyltransferase involved in cell wall biosynthesis
MLKIAMVAERTDFEDGHTMRTPYLTALSDALAGAGHEVTILMRRDNETAPDEEIRASGCQVVRVSAGPARRLTDEEIQYVSDEFADAIVARVRAVPVDVVHAHYWSAGLAATMAARALDLPVVHSVHSLAGRRPSSVRTTVERLTTRSAGHVVATFSGQVSTLVADGMSRDKISVVPYGVDVEHFVPEGGRADRRMRHRVVAVGDLAPRSGFGTTVAALGALPDTELVIAGGPLPGDHAAELIEYAHSLGVADRVHMLGPVPSAELPTLLRSADLMVCSPWDESFGVAAVEAMACGVAVVANGRGGLADTVVDAVTGVQVAPRKPRALATALWRMLSGNAVREQQGAAGRDRASVRYSWTRVAAETLHAYRRAGGADPADLAREAAAAARKRKQPQP